MPKKKKKRQLFRCDKGKAVFQKDKTDHTLRRLLHREAGASDLSMLPVPEIPLDSLSTSLLNKEALPPCQGFLSLFQPRVVLIHPFYTSFCGSAGKESACHAGDLGLIPGLGRSPGGGKGSHSSSLAWRIPWTVYIVHGVAKSQTQLSDFHFHF